VLLKDIAQRQQISTMYLEHLITPLITMGLVRSVRGPRGGVWLTKPPEEIRLSDVIAILEGSLAPVECINDTKFCPRADSCVTRELWGKLKRAMDQVLESTTLQDLVNQHREKESPYQAMYQI